MYEEAELLIDQINDIVGRLEDPEEYRGDLAIPPVGEDATELLRNIWIFLSNML